MRVLWYECLNSFAPIIDRFILIFTHRLALKAIQGVEPVTVFYLTTILQVVLW